MLWVWNQGICFDWRKSAKTLLRKFQTTKLNRRSELLVWRKRLSGVSGNVNIIFHSPFCSWWKYNDVTIWDWSEPHSDCRFIKISKNIFHFILWMKRFFSFLTMCLAARQIVLREYSLVFCYIILSSLWNHILLMSGKSFQIKTFSYVRQCICIIELVCLSENLLVRWHFFT